MLEGDRFFVSTVSPVVPSLEPKPRSGLLLRTFGGSNRRGKLKTPKTRAEQLEIAICDFNTIEPVTICDRLSLTAIS